MNAPEDRLYADFQRTGDPGALGEVYDLVSAELLHVAMHLTGHPADAEDLLQSTFIVAIERAAEFDATKPVRPWLVGILANRARLLRARAARQADPRRMRSENDLEAVREVGVRAASRRVAVPALVVVARARDDVQTTQCRRRVIDRLRDYAARRRGRVHEALEAILIDAQETVEERDLGLARPGDEDPGLGGEVVGTEDEIVRGDAGRARGRHRRRGTRRVHRADAVVAVPVAWFQPATWMR